MLLGYPGSAALQALETAGLDQSRRMALFLCFTLADETGGRLFEARDADVLMGKNVNVLMRLFAVAAKHNAITAAEIEDLEKNSAAGQDGDSISTSPATSG